MEKLIRETVLKNFDTKSGILEVGEITRQLASDFRAFMEWHHSRYSPVRNFVYKTKKFILWGHRKHFTSDELFRYWLDNVKKK